MYCSKCGHRIDNDSKFCVECGTKIDMKNKTTNINKKLEELKNGLDNILKKDIKDIIETNKNSDETCQPAIELNAEIEKLKSEKNSLLRELNNLNNELIIAYTNVDDYSNISSQETKNKLNMLKLEQNNLIKGNSAILITIRENLNKKVVNNNIAQILRNFNTECNLIFNNLTIRNIDTARYKLEKSFITLNKIFETDYVQISEKYYELKLKELTLHYNYLQKLEDEKEERKAIREQQLEEEKVRREIEQEKTRIEKEEKQFNNEISRLMKYMQKSKDIEKQLYIDKIKELEEKVKKLAKDKENIEKREYNTRAGWVYIISNVGSFGENVYKIGMTRRLEPRDRINELGDASVPFSFDIHALIFSDDAPTLETALHHTFKDYQVNKRNPRKEFYRVDLEKIKEVIRNNYNQTVKFQDYPEAEEYRNS